MIKIDAQFICDRCFKCEEGANFCKPWYAYQLGGDHLGRSIRNAIPRDWLEVGNKLLCAECAELVKKALRD